MFSLFTFETQRSVILIMDVVTSAEKRARRACFTPSERIHDICITTDLEKHDGCSEPPCIHHSPCVLQRNLYWEGLWRGKERSRSYQSSRSVRISIRHLLQSLDSLLCGPRTQVVRGVDSCDLLAQPRNHTTSHNIPRLWHIRSLRRRVEIGATDLFSEVWFTHALGAKQLTARGPVASK